MKKNLPQKDLKPFTSSSKTDDRTKKRASRSDTAKIETRRSPARSATITTTNNTPRKSSPILHDEDFTTYEYETRKNPSKNNATQNSPSRKIGTRPASPSRKRSPARKVLARSPINERHFNAPTSDKKRSPARKSPSRIPTKSTPKKAIREEIMKHMPMYDVDTDSDSQDSFIKEKPKATVRGRSRTTSDHKVASKISLSDSYSQGSVITRRSLRISQQTDNERIVHLKDTELLRNNLIEYSDEDEKEIVCLLPQTKKQVTEFGGSFGAMFFIMSLPLTIIGMNLICNKNGCSWNSLMETSVSLNPNDYLDGITLLSFIGFINVFFLLNAIPFGGRKITGLLNKHGRLDYCTNGLFILMVILTLSLGLEYCGIRVYGFIYEKYLKIAVSCVLIGIILSTYVYIRSFYVPISALNSHIINNSNLYNFFMGREVNPRLFGILDWKLATFRYLTIAIILCNIAILYEYIGPGLELSHIFDLRNVHETLYTCCFIQIITMLDCLLFEDVFLSSFEVQREGYGYMMIMGYFGMPIIFASISKCVLEHNVHLNPLMLFGQLIIFIIGTSVKRLADIQKHSFRMNPYSKAVSHLKTIPTASGKRLIVSGYWGVVRHPNYLGEMLIITSLIPFVVNTPHLILLIGNLLLLIHRIYRDDRNCREKYGSSWDKYCENVKYVLIPKIY